MCGRPELLREYHLFGLKAGMMLELRAGRVNRRSSFDQVRTEFNLHGTDREVYERFCSMHNMRP